MTTKLRTPAPDEALDRPDIQVTRALKILKRTEEIDFAEDGYEGLRITIWVNPPDTLVQHWVKDESAVLEVATALITAWTLEYADGGAADLDEATIATLPSDILQIVNREFWKRRLAPLVARIERDTSTSPKATPSPDSPTPTS